MHFLCFFDAISGGGGIDAFAVFGGNEGEVGLTGKKTKIGIWKNKKQDVSLRIIGYNRQEKEGLYETKNFDVCTGCPDRRNERWDL